MRKNTLSDYTIKILADECKKFYLQNAECEVKLKDITEHVNSSLNINASTDTISRVNAQIREGNLLSPYLLCYSNKKLICTRNINLINMSLDNFYSRAIGFLKTYSILKKAIIKNFGNNQEFNFQEYDKEIENILTDKEG